MVVRVCRAHGGGKREPGSLAQRVGCAATRCARSRPIFGVDGTNLCCRCRLQGTRPLLWPPPPPSSPALVGCLSSPPRCNRVRMVARSSSPRRRSPPRRRRRGATCASPTKPNAGAMRARVGIHAGGSGGGSRAPVLTAIDATELGLEDEGLTARAGTELTQEQPAGAARRVASRCVASAGTTEQTNGRTNDGCDNVHEPRCSVCAL